MNIRNKKHKQNLITTLQELNEIFQMEQKEWKYKELWTITDLYWDLGSRRKYQVKFITNDVELLNWPENSILKANLNIKLKKNYAKKLSHY